MPEVEIGRNSKGDFAVLKIVRSNPAYSVDEIMGLEEYKSIGVIHIPSDVGICCGPIEKNRLQSLINSNDNDIKKIKKYLT